MYTMQSLTQQGTLQHPIFCLGSWRGMRVGFFGEVDYFLLLLCMGCFTRMQKLMLHMGIFGFKFLKNAESDTRAKKR